MDDKEMKELSRIESALRNVSITSLDAKDLQSLKVAVGQTIEALIEICRMLQKK